MRACLARRSAATLALAGCGVVLRAGLAVLEPPTSLEPASLAWWVSTSPIDAAFTTVALLAVAVCALLLVLTVIDTIAVLCRVNTLVAVTSRLTPAFWRRAVLRPVALVTLATPQLLGPIGIGPALAAESFPVQTDEETAVWMVRAGDGPVVTMRRSPDTSPPEDAAIVPGVEHTTEVEHLAGAAHGTHVVVAGDNLWSIAEGVLVTHRGSAATPAEVVPYWRGLIEANRARLPDPHNPDLLFPGVELVLPPPG